MRSRCEAPAGHPKAPRASTTPARRVREEALEERPDDAPVVVGADRERRRPAPGAARPSRLDAPERRVDARARLRVRGRARRARPRAAGAAGDGVAECGRAGFAAARQPRRAAVAAEVREPGRQVRALLDRAQVPRRRVRGHRRFRRRADDDRGDHQRGCCHALPCILLPTALSKGGAASKLGVQAPTSTQIESDRVLVYHSPSCQGPLRTRTVVSGTSPR